VQYIAKLLGIDSAPGTEFAFRLNRGLDGWQVFMLGVLIIAFAIWIYRRDGKATSSPLYRTFLGVLRAALIALMVIILTEPVLVATQVEARRSTVIVLVDDSFSMELTFVDAEEKLRKQLLTALGNVKLVLKNQEGKEELVEVEKLEKHHFKMLSRLNVLSAMMRSPQDGGSGFLEALKEKHDVRIFGFGKEISDKNEDGSPINPQKLLVNNKHSGETRIGDVLRLALKELRGSPLAGVVVVSDGRQNAGEDAVSAAQIYRTQRVPIFTVGIGDPSEPKDFEVTVEGPEMVLPDDASEITALIHYKGYTDVDTIRVEMKDGEKVVDSKEVKLGKPGEKTLVSMRFKEAKAGKYVYAIKIPEQPGELRADNNSFTYNVQVVDKKVKVLFVEGQDLPRWEYRYLKNALRRDHTTEVDVLLSSSDGTFIWDGTDNKQPLEQFPINKKEINEYDVLIFGDVSPGIFTPEQVILVRDFVREGGGFIMIAGERYAPSEYIKAPWSEMLPVIPATAYVAPEGGFKEEFPLELTPEGSKLAWTHLEAEDNANREVWENLPRLFWYFPVERKKELATTVAVHPFDKDKQGNKMPLVVTMPYGAGRTMYIGVDSLWLWRRGVGDRYHYRFYNQSIRYLSMAKRLGGQKRFYLGTDRAVVSVSDSLIINAVVKDENHREVTQEKISVYGKNPKGEIFTKEMVRLKDRPGNYEVAYFPEMQGEYTLWLRDESQPDVHQSEVSFKAEKPQLEFENPRLDEELLQNIARSGGEGGVYVGIDRLREIPPRIKDIRENIIREKAFELWDNWLVFAIFTLFITIEWILRKRGRMI
jgi:uncharacterized membrane protein